MPARNGIEELDRDLRATRDLVGSSNATYARAIDELTRLLSGPTADDAILDRLELAWSARAFRAYYERPLLLLASLRADALASREHPLAGSLAADHPEPDLVTRGALAAALAPERKALWQNLGVRHVQTNDVSRAIAWRLVASVLRRPILLVDVGCAAGLNLIADRLSPSYREPSGERLELRAAPPILARYGFDADPIDVRHGDQAAWLRACVWPGEHARLDRLDDAIDAMVATWHRREPIRVEMARAEDMPWHLSSLTDRAPDGAIVLAYQTFLRDYLSGQEATSYERGMQHWVGGLSPGRGAWIELELADRTGPMPAELVVHVPTPEGPRSLTLARTGYHPTIVDVSRQALADLERLLEPGAEPRDER